METIFLPSKMYFTPTQREHEALLTIEPLHHGYGVTVGNALRRVLLSSLPGAAVTAVKIKGVQHEFQAVAGAKEDALDVVLNLKHLRMRVHSEDPIVLHLTAKGAGEVTAAQIEKNADVDIVNTDLVIATLTDPKATLDMEITVSRGRGFSPTEERSSAGAEIGVIAVDAMFSPVLSVGMNVEHTRVGEITNYDKLLVTITTDGSVTPQEAMEQATKILLNHFTWIQGQLQHASLTEQITTRAAEEEDAAAAEQNA